MNRLHVITRIQELVLSGTSPGEIYKTLRDECRNPSIEGLGLKRTDVDKLAEGSAKTLEQVQFPCERRHLELEIAETKIRADVLDAVATLDISNPTVAREVFNAHRQLGSSSGEPSILQALDLLDGAGHDTVSLRAALAVVFPRDTDLDATKPVPATGWSADPTVAP
jgi:hypothetical protein